MDISSLKKNRPLLIILVILFICGLCAICCGAVSLLPDPPQSLPSGSNIENTTSSQNETTQGQQEQEIIDEINSKDPLKNKSKAEVEEEERLRAEEDAQKELQELQTFRQEYQDYKSNYIDKAYENSQKLLDSVGGSSDMYQTRLIADSYRNYFRNSCYKSKDNLFSSIPSQYSSDIEQADSYFREYCSNNQYLASEIVDYTEASTTKKQYENLDSITNYVGIIADIRFNMDLTLLLMEEDMKISE